LIGLTSKLEKGQNETIQNSRPVLCILVRVRRYHDAQADHDKPLKLINTKIETVIGVSDGASCSIHITGKSKPGQASVGGNQISQPRINGSKCEVDFEVGELDEQDARSERANAVAAEQERVRHQMKGAILNSRQPEINNFGGTGTAHTRQWVTDPINLTTTESTAYLTWTHNGFNAVYSAYGSWTPYKLTLSGWQTGYEWGFLSFDSPSLASVNYQVDFYNPVFCLGNTTYANHDATDILGYGDGQYGWDAYLTLYGGCIGLLTYHWLAICDNGACY
jgi:hypothetical protein